MSIHKRHNRNARVWGQVMQRRVKRIVAENKRIARGTLPRSASYFDLGEHFSTTTQTTGQLTYEDVAKLIASLKDEMRADEQQSLYELLCYKPYYKSEVVRSSWKMPWRSDV